MALSCPAAATSKSALALYKPRRPEETALYHVIQENIETWIAGVREADDGWGGVPEYVEREFRSYLKCGIPAFGFARAFCDHCKHDFIIPFSCKKRGVCPSCGQRHMVETAAHLVDNVMPRRTTTGGSLSMPPSSSPTGTVQVWKSCSGTARVRPSPWVASSSSMRRPLLQTEEAGHPGSRYTVLVALSSLSTRTLLTGGCRPVQTLHKFRVCFAK